jgi:hypothetical protein
MPGHIEQTVAGQRQGFVRGALSVMSRLLAVARYPFRVGSDTCARTPRLFRIETVKRVQWARPCDNLRGPGLRGSGPSLIT